MTLTYGSLCTGYGGIELGLSMLTELDVRWQAENDPHASKILAERFPGVPNLSDIKTTDWTQVEPVDVMSAGYPCQPFSHAGQRKGHDDPRHLWPAVAHAISVVRPLWFIGENVRGHLTLGFDSVLADLARVGYDTTWGLVRASDAGAPHGRARVYFAATDTRSDGVDQRSRLNGILAGAQDSRAREGSQRQRDGNTPRDSGATAADADNERRDWPGLHGSGQRWRSQSADRDSRAAANTDIPRPQGAQPARRRDVLDGRVASHTAGDGRDEGWTEPAGQLRGFDVTECGDAPADADLDGLAQQRWEQPIQCHPDRRGSQDVAWGAYEPAIRRWEAVIGRQAPRPTEPGSRGGERLSPAFVEWMQGLPHGWVTDIDISRNEQLKALGNGVVPQQCALAVRTLLQLEARECVA